MAVNGNRSGAGFTLLELLIALVIFSLLASAAYLSLNSMGKSYQLQRQSAERWQRVQWAITRLERDLGQALLRPGRDQNGPLPAFRGEPRQLRLVRLESGPSTPQDPGLSAERPVYWFWQPNGLRRQLRQLPDQPSSSPPLRDSLLLEGVEQLEFRYLGQSGYWRNNWQSEPRAGLPLAVEVRLWIEDIGQLRRVIELPGVRG